MSGEKIRLSTGFVRAAGYANKLRRTLLAQTRGKIEANEAIRVAALINMRLFEVLQENNVDKADVVRIIFYYTITDAGGKKTISVDWDSFSIEVYKNAGVIEGITPPKETELPAPEPVPQVGEWREIDYNDNIFMKLKIKADEILKTAQGYSLKGPNFEAEVVDKDKIRIKYTGPESEASTFYAEILGE